ncbi:MAG: 16S rRNA (guanine(527)-N(7))-methyltransferase RsmG [Bacteroidales bacterium]|nr:16S rRNA (guanine(527)-N(7))-methyltransferase RsmG [Bacteroidales bacterium]
MEIILKYFPTLTESQIEKFQQLGSLYSEWNQRINLISRKDIGHLYERHVLHSLSIAKVLNFLPGTKILDVGTGGGFPGIPLAILFPESSFHLVDSIGKKITVVKEVKTALGLKNVSQEQKRAEELSGNYDFIVSRAVTSLPVFYKWVKHLIKKESRHHIKNGILYLKGGDFADELNSTPMAAKVYSISSIFEENFFETKSVVHLYQK